MKVLNIIIAVLLLGSSVFAGTTGKIAGKIVDKETGEPLIGANVVIEGTTLGAATDFEGEYYIINIPPGVYNVRATMIGYAAQVVEKVRVQVDLTTKVDFTISSEALQINQEVTVVANRVIQKDLTSSERSMQADQIEALPARDTKSLLSLQAGVVKDAGGNIHIRGGRSSEVSYMVDGVQVMNPLDRTSGIEIDYQAVDEMKAITGTFNAEYGQALSGVVNIVTKKGSDKFTANATVYGSDYVSFDKELYSVMDNAEWARAAAEALTTKSGRLNYDLSKYGINTTDELMNALESKSKPWLEKKSYLNKFNPFKRYDAQLNLSGPVPFTNKVLSYFVAGRYQDQPGYQYGKRYFMPWGMWTPKGDSLHNYEMPDNELVPLDWRKDLSSQAKLFVNFDKLVLSYGLYYNNSHNYYGGQKYLPDGGLNSYTDRFTHIASMTYIFSGSTFLDVRGSYYTNDNKTYLYEDPYDYRYMPNSGGDFTQYIFKPTKDDDRQINTNNNDFSFYGNNTYRSKNVNKYFSANLDLTTQVDKYNMVKMGISGRLHNLEQDYYNLQFSQSNYRPIVPDKSSAYHTFYAAKPQEFAAYIQDKIEFDELIINLGLRFDYFYSDGRVLADQKDPQIYAPFKMENIYKNYAQGVPDSMLVKYTPEERGAFWYKKPDAKYQFSPRFGFSFPITERGVVHFSYGHFFQNPEFRYLYENPNFWIAGAGATNLVGNADLNAERTVIYEIGLQQSVNDELSFNITGFYRDIRDWVGSGYAIDTYSGLTYYSYVNKDNAVAKGLTLSTSYTFGDFDLKLDYTYMNVSGTSSDPRDAYNSISGGGRPRVQMINLNWDQPHSANLAFSYVKDAWVATLVGRLNSGFPYTPSSIRGESTGANAQTGYRENSERRPMTMNLDLHVSRAFSLGSFELEAICDVTNLLDIRNASYVYSDTGLPDYTLQDYQSYNRFLEISNTDEFFRSPGMYSAPRSISLGVRVSYK